MIQLRGLSKDYGGFHAVGPLTFAVERGELFGLLGANGAGKTTTLRLLMGMLRATGGTATIAGQDCFRDRATLMRIVGYLPDDPVFYDYLRAFEIVRFVGAMHGLSRRETESRAASLLERFDLADAASEFAANYSRGMKKRLGLVCALLHEPALLVLDEPAAGLDPVALRRLDELLVEKARGGTTVLLSSHILDQVERTCARMAFLVGGRLAAFGDLNELRAASGADGTLEDVFLSLADPSRTDATGQRGAG